MVSFVRLRSPRCIGQDEISRVRDSLEAALVWGNEHGGREAGRAVSKMLREESEGEREERKAGWKQHYWQDSSERFDRDFELIFLSQRNTESPRTWPASVPAPLSRWWEAAFGGVALAPVPCWTSESPSSWGPFFFFFFSKIVY